MIKHIVVYTLKEGVNKAEAVESAEAPKKTTRTRKKAEPAAEEESAPVKKPRTRKSAKKTEE